MSQSQYCDHGIRRIKCTWCATEQGGFRSSAAYARIGQVIDLTRTPCTVSDCPHDYEDGCGREGCPSFIPLLPMSPTPLVQMESTLGEPPTALVKVVGRREHGQDL